MEEKEEEAAGTHFHMVSAGRSRQLMDGRTRNAQEVVVSMLAMKNSYFLSDDLPDAHARLYVLSFFLFYTAPPPPARTVRTGPYQIIRGLDREMERERAVDMKQR